MRSLVKSNPFLAGCLGWEVLGLMSSCLGLENGAKEERGRGQAGVRDHRNGYRERLGIVWTMGMAGY